jgi:SAM-dependent methyltransferase
VRNFPVTFATTMLLACAAPQEHPSTPHKHDHKQHRFQDAAAWSREFDAPSRDAWQKPDAVVASLALAPDARVADLGAGTGYFTMRLARAVPKGTVWGIDVEPDMVRWLRERAVKEGLANVEAVIATADDPKLATNVDVVFVCDTYHHLESREAYLKKVVAALSPTGRVVIVDFKMGDIPVGPPPSARVSVEQLDREMASAGLQRRSLDEATLPHQYIAVYGRLTRPSSTLTSARPGGFRTDAASNPLASRAVFTSSDVAKCRCVRPRTNTPSSFRNAREEAIVSCSPVRYVSAT